MGEVKIIFSGVSRVIYIFEQYIKLPGFIVNLLK